MASVARGETIDCSNSKLDVFTKVNGVKVDVFALSYRILDPLDAEVVSSTAVDVDQDCPTGQRLGVGNYVITSWTVPVGQLLGTHKLEWTITLAVGVAATFFVEEFEVLTVSGAASDGYVTVGELRAEGFPDESAGGMSDADLATLITRESRRIDRLTHQWFEPRSLVLALDGSGHRALTLHVPIVSIASITILESAEVLDATSYRVYNRHLTQQLVDPDDRTDPRVEFAQQDGTVGDIFQRFGARVFPRGQQNIELDGVFGYTDPPGPVGVTPELIKYATQLLVMRNFGKVWTDQGAISAAQAQSRVAAERTRDQQINYKSPREAGAYGYLTGDSEIDGILEHYMAPLSIGDTSGGL